jgi:probable F420-dependent oxidoreductase
MLVETSLPNADLREVGANATALEAAGFDTITTQENRHDPYLPLAVAAVSTSSVGLATNVAIAFPRSPMVAANLGWDLQKASGGRFELGLGSQVKGHNERRFSVPWSAPAPRLQEYVEAVRAIWKTWADGDRLDYQGDHYQFSLMTPNFTPEPLDTPPPRIAISAVGPGMLRVAGRVADGVRLHPFCTREYVEAAVMPQLQTGLEQRGRQRADLSIIGGGFVCTGPDDEAVAKAMEWVRYRIGFYGSTRAYWPVLEQHDMVELGEKLNHLSKNDGWNQMADLVSDDVVRLFAAVGRHDQIVAAITERFGGVADGISLGSGVGSDTDADNEVPPDLMAEIKTI